MYHPSGHLQRVAAGTHDPKMDVDPTPDCPTAHADINHPEDNFYTPFNQEFYARNSYSNLDASKHEIRLLELLPVKDD
jgi:hypothetical protein